MAVGVDDEDAVGGGFEGGAQERERAVAGGFGLFAGGDVEDGGEAVGLSPDRDETAAVNDGEDLAVFPAHFGLEPADGAVELKFGEVAGAHGGIHPELEFAGGAPDDFGAGESEHGEGGGVEFGDGAVGNGEEADTDRAAVEQAAETLFAFAERGGAEFGVAHRLFVQAGVVQHERRHPGKQEAFPDVFGGKGSPGGFAREAEDADTLVATDDGENGRRAEAAGAIDGAAVGIGRVVVHDHRGACGDGPPGQGWFAATHAVAEEEGSAGREGANDEGVVFEE